jgi:hypothetical protein
VPAVKTEARRGPNRLAQGTGGVLSFADGALEKASQNPVRFEAISMAAAIVAGIFYRLLFREMRVPLLSVNWTLSSFLFVLTAVAALACQMGAFFRRRMARYALYGGLVFWLGTALPAMSMVWLGLHPQSEFGRGLQVFSVGLGMIFLGAIYAGVAALASLAGGWVHLKREDLEWERLTRQELLEQYFELQRRLDESGSSEEDLSGWEHWQAIRAVRRRPIAAAAVIGLSVGVIRVVLSIAFHVNPSEISANEAFNILTGVHTLDGYVLFGVVAFFSGRAARGLASALAYATAVSVPALLPIGGLVSSSCLGVSISR